MKKNILILGMVAALAAVIIVFTVLKKPSEEKGTDLEPVEKKAAAEKVAAEKKDQIEVPPLNISLELIPGQAHDKSLVVLRLFSRKLQQQRLDGKKSDEISPISLTADENTWTAGIAFFLTGGGQVDKERISLLRAPKDKEMRFSPSTVFQIFYEISPTSLLTPGKQLSAALHLDPYTLESNRVTIPPLADNEFERALRAARIASLTDPSQLLDAAETLIQEQPESYLGYWYQARALEYRKDYEAALESYNAALKRYPPSSETEHYEPPVYIVRKITQLRKQLSR
ncbi:MAG: hypothetical protein GF421_08420 [Candidatus Aminicenantes bacterium]|nr:hypothetical protein [Candidatus Aminicenantes bacterium]